ncbi:hypothetical protein FHS59_000379 [Algoriphagus iocasae]|uniref:Uncharacterized protein n=1 Tax=Algoriphagus iocasae TaxID=1836499 RepID=A0A841MIR7_9BACT|nr:hypothetical protein [Algoriphagus iocasae]
MVALSLIGEAKPDTKVLGFFHVLILINLVYIIFSLFR